jgi:hypothetical protein
MSFGATHPKALIHRVSLNTMAPVSATMTGVLFLPMLAEGGFTVHFW